ncbi:7174_t:CDS:2, partial [Cetraspora pellucida]
MSCKNSPPAKEDTIMLDNMDRESVVGPEAGPLGVNWSKLRLVDLQAMCKRCNLPSKSTKTELVERLEDFWNESEEVEKLQKEYDILRFMENRLKEKIESKFESAVMAVLERNLQQFASQFRNLQEVLVETKFLEKKFKRMRDQHEYDFVCQVGKLLTKAIQEESIVRVHEAFNIVKIRAFTLRTAEDEGWRVAANIPKLAPTEKDELHELLIEARKQAKPKEHKPFQRPSSQRFTPYPQVQDLRQGQYQQAYQGHQKQAFFTNSGPSFMSANKRSSQLVCYYCGGMGHIASACASKTESSISKEGFFVK